MDPFPLEIEIVAETVIAMVLGGLVGIEREILNKPAGFRTHMLVAGAAALLIGMGDAMVLEFGDEAPTGVIRADPIRILEAVITGVSFLGAGTIFRGGTYSAVGGLTTAASILMSAAIGIAVGLNKLMTALAVTLLVLLVLRGLRVVEVWVGRRKRERRSRGDEG